jgi:hypothetical protein
MSLLYRQILSLLTATALVVSTSRCVCASAAEVSAKPVVAAHVTPSSGNTHACCSEPSPPVRAVATFEMKAAAAGGHGSRSHCNHCKLTQASTTADQPVVPAGPGSHFAIAAPPADTFGLLSSLVAAARPATGGPPRPGGESTLLALHCSLLN